MRQIYNPCLPLGVYIPDGSVFDRPFRREYRPAMAAELRESRYQAWLSAVRMICGR